jgi:hypothetical protein
VIEGLKLTMTGVQLRTNIEGRIRWHQSEIRRMSRQAKSNQNDGELMYPAHILENEIGCAERRIEVLTFIRDYIVADEVYRLGEFDLRFADLLPDDDPWDCDCMSAVARDASLKKEPSEPH